MFSRFRNKPEYLHNLNPRNGIIAFDLHGVLFKADFWRIIRLFWKTPHKRIIIEHGLNPRVMQDFWCVARRGLVLEQFFSYAATKYPRLIPVIPLLKEVSNAHRPQKAIIELVGELKAKGYTLHILSNIGKEMFTDLYTQFPHAFQDFDAIRLATPTDNYLCKPNPALYHSYLKEFNPHNKLVVLIDDRRKNVRGAQDAGMIGVRFKNAGKLRKQIIALEK